jgi:5-methylcytosine-specific restriction endonuclease McrA
MFPKILKYWQITWSTITPESNLIKPLVMLTSLRSAKLITSTRIRDNDWQNEAEHRSEFARFLREIPQDFRIIARHKDKRELVKGHLKTFYMRLPQEHEVNTVLERITNLASLMEVGRNSFENKAGQYKFKSEHWEDSRRCEICGREFSSFNDVTLDHIVPLSLGGSEREDNWQLTCTLCNSQKQEYWGISDLSRLVSLKSCQGDLANFFKLSATTVIDQLMLKGNPTRYWIFERDFRKCSCCKATAKETKLCIVPRENGFLPVIDALVTSCLDCATKNKLPHCI